jgi:hypothetical protein
MEIYTGRPVPGEKMGISSCRGGEGKEKQCLPAAWIWRDVVGLKSLVFSGKEMAVDEMLSRRVSDLEAA